MSKWALALVAAAAAAVLGYRQLAPRKPAELRGLASVSVPEGFEVSLAAKPGLVRYPMLGTIDDRGRIFMCESSGKTMKTPEMSADPNYVVSMLEDTDRDGVYDKSTTFADKLTLPAGAVWHRGSLYVAAPPHLLRLEDTNNDGVADVRETVVTGWRLSANAASLHGPILGPDGWLYLTDGRHGYNIDTRDGRHWEGKAARIWRVRPDGTGLEWYAGGGFDNPVEVVFTEGGDMFGTMTYFQDPADGKRDSILHFVEGGCYPKPNPVIDEFKRTGDLMPVMTKFARIAPAGLLRHSGVGFPPAYKANLYTAQFNAHRVQRHMVSRDGATYKTEDSDFFVSSDPDMHPTDVMEDSDGSMIVVDTGAWFIHGCPISRVSKPDILGALYRVRRKDAPRLAPADTRSASPENLAKLLDDPRPSIREAAVDGLARAGEVARLAAARSAAATVEGATGAVYGLSRVGSPEALAAIREALADQRAEVRQAAARQSGMARDKAAVQLLMAMARREEPGVRRQAAASLGMIGDAQAVSALLDAAANPEDRFVEHSVIYSLIQLGQAAPLSASLASDKPGVRKAALIALDQLDKSPLREDQLMPFLGDANPDLRRTALWVASRHPKWAARVASVLEARFRAPQFPASESEVVADAIGAFCADPSMRKAIGKALGDATLDPQRHLFLLKAAERCSSREFPAEWTDGMRRLLGHADPKVRAATIVLARTRGLTALDADLRRIALAAGEKDEVRVAALSVVVSRSPKLAAPEFDYLISLASPKAEADHKLAAGQILSRAEFSPEQLAAIASKHLRECDPLVLPNLLDAFRNSGDEATGRSLVKALAAVESSLGTVGSQRVEQLVKKFPASVREEAKPLIARIEQGRNSRMEKIRRLEPVLSASGDAANGRTVFFGSKAGCGSCHTIGTQGGHVGPDLTSIGAIRSPHDLLEAIVLPSESFVPGHEVYRVETEREVYSGLLKRGGAAEVVILTTGPNDEVRIPRKEVKKMGYAPVSLMPEGFDEVLSQRELTDLMAFLRSQTSRAASNTD
jgi:putative membrane-bound dehydrogenase-like protein